MKKNRLRTTVFAAFALLAGYHVHNAQKNERISDLVLANVEALADDEASSVTCVPDKGDTCIVGNTTISDYDEGCASWFWG